MIPHHENAVNTAKTLLKTGNLLCPDITDTQNPDCLLEGILFEIVASQNHQIQLMKHFLQLRQYPEKDNCNVYVETTGLSKLPESHDDTHLHDSFSQGLSITLSTFVWAASTLIGWIL